MEDQLDCTKSHCYVYHIKEKTNVTTKFEPNNQEVIRRDKNMRTAPLSKEPWEHLRVEVRFEIK